MRAILLCVFLALLPSCHPIGEGTPPTSLRVIEYGEITGLLPSPTLHVWLVADSKRDLCLVVFNSSHNGVSSQKIDCAAVKPKPERECPRH